MIKHNSIRKKIFSYTAYLSVILVVVLFIIISINYYKQIISLKTKVSINEIKYIEDQINLLRSTAENYSKSILSDKVFQANMEKYNSDSKSFNALNQLAMKERIHHIIQSTDYIDFVTVYSPSRKIVLSTNNSIKNTDDIISTKNKKWHIIENENKKYISLTRPFYNIRTGAILGYIQIGISENEIYNIYLGKNSVHEEIFILAKKFSLNYKNELSSYYYQLNAENIIDENIFKICDFHIKKNNSKITYISKKAGYIYMTNKPIYFFKEFDNSDWFIFSSISIKKFLAPIMPNFITILIICILAICISLYTSKKISLSISKPLYSLINHTKTISKGGWKTLSSSELNTQNSDTEILNLIDEFNAMIISRKKLEKELIKTEREKNNIEIDLLQSQIKPHFLYNTLDNIIALSDLDEKEKLSSLVMNLSNFYRQSLSGGENIITLKEDLDISISYLKILQIRYPNKFDYTITCNKKLYDVKIIKLLLQPILENSIYHGIKEIEYKGSLNINIWEEHKDLILEISDNGKGLGKNISTKDLFSSNEHYGLKNIDRRIKLQYGNNYGIKIENIKPCGCKTTIKIKKGRI